MNRSILSKCATAHRHERQPDNAGWTAPLSTITSNGSVICGQLQKPCFLAQRPRINADFQDFWPKSALILKNALMKIIDTKSLYSTMKNINAKNPLSKTPEYTPKRKQQSTKKIMRRLQAPTSSPICWQFLEVYCHLI